MYINVLYVLYNFKVLIILNFYNYIINDIIFQLIYFDDPKY